MALAGPTGQGQRWSSVATVTVDTPRCQKPSVNTEYDLIDSQKHHLRTKHVSLGRTERKGGSQRSEMMDYVPVPGKAFLRRWGSRNGTVGEGQGRQGGSQVPASNKASYYYKV